MVAKVQTKNVGSEILLQMKMPNAGCFIFWGLAILCEYSGSSWVLMNFFTGLKAEYLYWVKNKLLAFAWLLNSILSKLLTSNKSYYWWAWTVNCMIEFIT